MHIEKSLASIHSLAAEKEEENQQFALLLKSQPSEKIDTLVADLNNQIAPQIDCTNCGNCCKSLMINVTNEEADALSLHLNQSRSSFDAQYLEVGSTAMVMNTFPCAFLAEEKCTVYEHRFAGCREFPALHVPHFTKRLFTTFMHYGRCPIIFNVVENLKSLILNS